MSLLETIIQKPAWKPQRFLIYGTPGVGKTTFAASAPKPILLNVEDGLGDISCPHWPTNAKTFDEVLGRMRSLYSEKHDFETFILDGLTGVRPFVYKKVCEEKGKEHIEDFGYGKGYEYALVYWQKLMDGLEALRDKGMTIVLICHDQVKSHNNPETDSYDRYMPLLDKQASSLFLKWADNVFFLTYQIYTSKSGQGFAEKNKAKGGEKRVIRTQERGTHIAKNRLRNIPYELTLQKEDGWSVLEPYLPKPKQQAEKIVKPEPKKEGK